MKEMCRSSLLPSPCCAPRCALVLVLSLFPLGCGKDSPAVREVAHPPWFEDVTEKVGLDFVHDAGPVDEARHFMPQIVGSGAAVFDFDGDGLLDIYLLNNGGPRGKPNCLFRQLPDGKFKDVSLGSGLDIAGYNMGVAIGDVNNDGHPDVLVTQYGGVKLFLNNGNGTFTDVTREAGLDNPLWATSAAFLDYDRDGWLDLVVVNYVDYDPSWPCAGLGGQPDYCPPNQFPGTVSKLFHNRGPNSAGGGRGSVPGRRVPRFEDVTLSSGLGRVPGPGLGVACADFDGDGWPDILVANDGAPNRLWINQKNGTFVDEAVVRGIAYNGPGQAQANMGIALGDVDGDGVFDVFMTHLTEETNTLWRQGPRGLFRDGTPAAGLASPRWRGTGWGAVLADFDHDGALDLALVNGRVARGKATASLLGAHWSRYAERNQLFANNGSGQFTDISMENEPFCGPAGVYRGLVAADIDGDGALDLLVTAVAGPARLYRNVAPQRGHWLMVRAIDPALRRDAYGAEITVRAGSRRWVSGISPNQGYLCSHDCRAHFGLGSAARLDAIEVLWPDGTRELFAGRPADQVVQLLRGQGKPLAK
jgi:enediyne biosynthesis protein E4